LDVREVPMMNKFGWITMILLMSGVALGKPPAGDKADRDVEVEREIIEYGPALGVEAQSLTPELKEHFGAGDAGVLVGKVVRGAPAEAAGVHVGDVIVEVDHHPIRDLRDLRRVVASSAGRDVEVVVVRDHSRQVLSAQIAASEGTDVEHVGRVEGVEQLEDMMEDFQREADGWRTPMGDDMETRIRDLEDGLLEVNQRLDSTVAQMEDELDSMDRRIDEEHGEH